MNDDVFVPGKLTLPELAMKVNECHRAFLSAARTTIESAWLGGGYLLEAKGKVASGDFGQWLEDNTEISDRQAQKWMRIHAKVPLSALTTDLRIENCLKLLAAQPNDEPDYEARDARLRSRAAAFPDGVHHILLADPPWRYDHAPAGDPGRSVESNYPTMSLQELEEMTDVNGRRVPDLAAPDALLFMWTTSPKLTKSLWLVEQWGFEYRTCLVWVKDKIGTGYHARAQHELVLIAKRGQMPPPAPELRQSSVIYADRGLHSAKPVELYERIEAAYPDFSRVELFSRTPRPGWAAWGYEAVNAA